MAQLTSSHQATAADPLGDLPPGLTKISWGGDDDFST